MAQFNVRASLVVVAALLIAVALPLATSGPAWSHDGADLPALAERFEPSVVALIAHQPKRRKAAERYDIMGAGFFVSTDGHIVTANHVLLRIIRPEGHVRRGDELSRLAVGWVTDPAQPNATIVTNERRTVVRVVRQDPARDLALLRVATESVAVPLAPDTVATGTDVAFFGFPFGSKLGFRPLLNRGTIAGRRKLPGRESGARYYSGYIVDGSVHPGHSGAPIVDTRTGAVVAMVQRRLTQTIPVAVASEEILSFLRDAGVALDVVPVSQPLGPLPD